jgi:hypothetical protein
VRLRTQEHEIFRVREPQKKRERRKEKKQSKRQKKKKSRSGSIESCNRAEAESIRKPCALREGASRRWGRLREGGNCGGRAWVERGEGLGDFVSRGDCPSLKVSGALAAEPPNRNGSMPEGLHQLTAPYPRQLISAASDVTPPRGEALGSCISIFIFASAAPRRSLITTWPSVRADMPFAKKLWEIKL